jgi:hydrogenase expression/formation protein HypC
MCLGVPMQVLAVEGNLARCTGRDGEQWIDTRLVGVPEPGQWVMTFLGAARALLCEEEATRSQAALAALDAVLAGETDVSAYFADLIGREPELPEFLRKPAHD